MLEESSDEDHPLSTARIISELEEYGIHSERKSIYDDIEKLKDFGYDIISVKSRLGGGYYLASREFELVELKLLADAVLSSKFLTTKKSRDLIKKLEHKASPQDAKRLQRQIIVAGRVKTENESIYYSIDTIHCAIQDNRQIKFVYLDWNLSKRLEPRENGNKVVSPWALVWKDENYYLVAFDHEDEKIKHYRVDKINKIKITDKKRQGKEHFAAFDMAAYSKMNFGMFGGKETKVKLRFKDEMVGVLLDRFGKDISIRKSATNGWSETNVDVAVSDQFFGWIFALGGSVVIAGPDEVKMRFKEELEKVKELYK